MGCVGGGRGRGAGGTEEEERRGQMQATLHRLRAMQASLLVGLLALLGLLALAALTAGAGLPAVAAFCFVPPAVMPCCICA